MTKMLSLESIEFQHDKRLFNLLLEAVIKARKSSIKTEDVYNEISQLLNKETGINVEVIDFYQPFSSYFVLTNKHIFDTKFDIKRRIELQGDSEDTILKTTLELIDKSYLVGSVDIKNVRVSGDFSKIPTNIGLPILWLKSNLFTPEEITSIILHELGHIFINYEFLNRTASTNQILSALTFANDKRVSNESRIYIVNEIDKKVKFTNEEKELLKSTTNEAMISTILINKMVERCESELGGSIFDVTFCEFLADQFATRMGAGRHLITGLDKVQRAGGYTADNIFTMIIMAIAVWPLTIGAIVTSPMWLLYLAAKEDKETDIHRTGQIRFERIRNEYVEVLKRKDISNQLRKEMLAEIELVDRVIKNYKENLSLIQKVAYYLRPSYRKAHKYELLQRDLESLAGNQLFESAAKLKLI